MIVTAYDIGTDKKGNSKVDSLGEFEVFSWIIKSTQKAIKGGNLIVYDAQITALTPLPESSVIELEGKWFQVSSPAVGMLGMYRHYLTETLTPGDI